MFKGIISLFVSGAVFSPFVLLGIVVGSLCYFNMEPLEIRNLFFKKEFYALIIITAVMFVFVFSKVYDYSGRHLDLSAMFIKVIANVVKFFISFVLIMSFISMISIF